MSELRVAPAKSIDLYDLMLQQYDQDIFFSYLRGEMANPFRARSLVDQIKALSICHPVEEAMRMAGAVVTDAPINSKTGKPYGRDTQALQMHLAHRNIDPAFALFEDDIAEINQFKRACAPKMQGVTATPCEPKSAVWGQIANPPLCYMLACGTTAPDRYIIDTTTNWDPSDCGQRTEYGLNSKAMARAEVYMAISNVTAAEDEHNPDTFILLAETCPPYRMNNNLDVKHRHRPNPQKIIHEYLEALDAFKKTPYPHELTEDRASACWPSDNNFDS